MINRAMLSIVHPFLYDARNLKALASVKVLSDSERDDFLPYVGNFFSCSNEGDVRAISLGSFNVEMKSKISANTTGEQAIESGKIYFLTHGIGILTLSYPFDSLEETDFAKIQRMLCRLDKVNTTVFRATSTTDVNDAIWLSAKEWYSSLVSPYLTLDENERCSFNPFNRSSIISSSILAVGRDYPDKPAFMEALLLNRRLDKGENGSFLADSVHRVRQSESIESFGNSTGVVYLCRDSGNEFSRIGVFDVYGKNYLLVFLITVYQQVRIQTLIEKSSRIIAPNQSTNAVKELKAEILTYLARYDFTQISHNPARNLLYKFFRRNFELKELLEEVSTITKKIDQEIEAENTHIHAKKVQKGEKIALILEVLILPYYLHHIIELIVKYFSADEHLIHEVSFWGTAGVTITVILSIQVLLRVFRK